uniref:Bm8034 n=1 Tax=Brugia malayi TaxID=6279 RepID=A0A0H5BRS0_BRUMA|nr:Bm8034 [Brugia malayi]CDP90991.1 Bm8035 [Brugia malayi]
MMDVSDIGNLASDSSAGATRKQCLQQQQTADQLAVSAAVATAQPTAANGRCYWL